MELLTGKAKEGFNQWVDNQVYDRFFSYSHLNELDAVCKISLIIDWLDSVGIFINIKSFKFLYDWSFEIKQFKKKTIVMDDLKDALVSRQEATVEAIKKANEIYNKQHE